MMLRLAFRNVMEHRRKTLTVGGLMAFALALLIVGSSVMDNLNRGMASSFTEQFTGDLFIYPKQDLEPTVFGSNTPLQETSLAPLTGYRDLASELNAIDGVQAVSPQQVGMARVDNQRGAQSFSFLWGVDPEDYQATFEQPVELISGGFWEAGEAGMLLNVQVADDLGGEDGQPVQVGDTLLLTHQSPAGAKIREVTVTGLFRFSQIASPQLEQMSLISDAVAQPLFALSDKEAKPVRLSESERSQLGGVSEDSLFGGASLTEQADGGGIAPITLDPAPRPQPGTPDLVPADLWHFALVTVTDEADPEAVASAIETLADREGLDWRVAGWEAGAGMVAELAGVTRMVLYALFVIIGVVSIIIIMNTLVISVTERMTEIGTMRALGAQKGFVRRLILTETLVIGGLAGVVGVALGGSVLAVINQVGITPPAGFFEILFGGTALHPSLSIRSVFEAGSLILLTSLLASLYPIALALRVSPVRAMQA